MTLLGVNFLGVITYQRIFNECLSCQSSFFVHRLLLILRHLDAKNRPSSATVKLAKFFYIWNVSIGPRNILQNLSSYAFNFVLRFFEITKNNPSSKIFSLILILHSNVLVPIYLNQKWFWKSSLTWGKLSLNYSWQVLRTERRDSQRDRIFCFCQFAAVNAAADRYSHLLLWSHFVLHRR